MNPSSTSSSSEQQQQAAIGDMNDSLPLSSSSSSSITNLLLSTLPNTNSAHHQKMVNALAGSMSGVISTIVLAPLDVVKTRLIIQRIPVKIPTHYTHLSNQHIPKYQKSKGILGTMKHMIKHEGITSLYKGLGTNLLGYVPNWAIYFTSYEHFKESFGKSALLSNHVHLNHVFSSMLSGFITSFITSPMWVVKTRMQTQVEKKYTGTFHALSEIFKTEGIRGLYRGLAPSLFGLIHVGVQFPTYGMFLFHSINNYLMIIFE